jgi:spermidine/putrescine transport system substrate-binding protein
MNKTLLQVYSKFHLNSWFLACFASLVFVMGCTATKPTEPAAEAAKTAGTEPVKKGNVTLAIWPAYITPEMIQEFETTTGYSLTVSNFSSNEELLGKLQAGASGYDVIVPSDYMVLVMQKLELIQKLDRSKIENLSQVDPRFVGKSYDPNLEYSAPYGWGTTGIAYNSEVFPKGIKGWKDLLNNPKAKGKFSLLDDSRETIAAALKANGLSLNSSKPEDLAKAKALLIQARSQIKAFHSEPYQLLVQGEVVAAHAYSSDALRASAKTKGKIKYTLPEEGGTYWVDALAIPKGATNIEGAHELINFLLSSKINTQKSINVFTAPVLKDAANLLPVALKNDSTFIPTEAALKNFEMLEDLGDQTALWDRVWTEIKASK